MKILKSLFFIGFFTFFSFNSICQNTDIRVYNKTTCTAQITVICANSTTGSANVAANGFFDYSCPTNNTPCEVILELPGGLVGVPDVTTVNPFVFCSGMNSVNPNPSCYSENVEWDEITAHYVLNVY